MGKVIGYGVCGPGEAGRYMKETLDEFKRLCDVVVILCNNCDQPEFDLIEEYGFTYVKDRREWGAHQWRIKQDFIEREIKQIANDGDMLVCLDMDETMPKLTKEWLQHAKLDAYHVFIADLWNDEQHFKLESCFWNVRIWRWNGETAFKPKPVHCGLAPQWTYFYHRHAPFVLIHKGLMLKEDRARKLERYAKYDPHAAHLDRRYYDMLKSNTAQDFDFDALSQQIEEEVATYQQTKPRKNMAVKKERFAYVRNPHGQVVDIPEKHVEKTLKRPGFEWVGWADEEQADIEDMFEDTEVDAATPSYRPHPKTPNDEVVRAGSYQRPIEDEAREIKEINNGGPVTGDASGENIDELFEEEDGTHDVPQGSTDTPEHPKPNPNKPKEDPKPEPKVEAPKESKSEQRRKAIQKTATKKAPAKKAAAKKK